MSIMKNFFGGSGDSSKKQRKAHVESKHCTICQEAFKTGTDDFRLPNCVACVDSGRVKNADFYRQQFLEKKANTLSPDMALLLEKLEQNRLGKAMLEGREATVRIAQESGTRTREAIKHEQLKYVASLDSIKAQVLDYLPAIVAELGLTDKVDIELVADMLVPAKINAPLHDNIHAKATLRSVVMEELTRLQYTAGMIQSEAAVQPKSKPGLKKTAGIEDVLHEGITRVSNDSSFSRQIRKQANDGVFAPVMDPGQQMAADPMAADPMMGAGVGEGMAPDMMSAPPDEIVGDVVRVDDSLGEPELPVTMMNEGIIPNSQEGFAPQTPDMGAGMPQMDGGVNRVQQAAAPRVRPLKKTALKVEKPANFDIFSFAGRVAKNVPVQAIKLDAEARSVINRTTPVNQIIAQYTDGSTKTWNYYLTDKGALFASKDAEFFAETPHRFADFLSTDSAFVKFAYLPEELMTSEVVPQTDPAGVALPEQGMAGGDPTFDSIEPTVLEQPIMEHQDTLLQNQEPHMDALLDTAVELLPSFESALPNAPAADHMNMALAAAADFLNYVVKTADYDIANVQSHPDFPRYKQHIVNNPKWQGDFFDWQSAQNAPAPVEKAPVSSPLGGRPTNKGDMGNQMRHDETMRQVQTPTPTNPLLGMVEQNGVDVPVDKIRNEQYQQIAPTVQPDFAASGIDETGHYNPNLDPRRQEKNERFRSLSNEDPFGEIAASPAVKDILEVTAGMSEAEFFEIGAPALIEAGYSDEEIMTAYATTWADIKRQENTTPPRAPRNTKTRGRRQPLDLSEETYNDPQWDGPDDGPDTQTLHDFAMLKKEADNGDQVFGDYGAVEAVVNYTEPTEESKRGLHNEHPDGAQEQSMDMIGAESAE